MSIGHKLDKARNGIHKDKGIKRDCNTYSTGNSPARTFLCRRTEREREKERYGHEISGNA